MTDQEIRRLLNNPNLMDLSNISALERIPFDRVREIMEENHDTGRLIGVMYSFIQAQYQVEMTSRKPYDSDLINFRQAAASFWNLASSLPTDVYNFATYTLVLWRKGILTGPYQQALSPLADQKESIRAYEKAKSAMTIQAVRPKNYVMQVDNVFRHLPELEEGGNEIYAGKKGRQEISTLVNFSLPEQYKLDGKDHMDAYDKAILNGVNSLLESDSVNFTIPMLYHAMTGKVNPTVESSLLNELRNRIEGMRRTLITIDLSQELEARYLDFNVSEPQMQGYLLPLTQYSARVNGKLVQVYHLLDTPPMLAYAKMKRQLATVPLTLLNAPLNNNTTTIPLKNYLITRCESMRNPNNKVANNKILFEALFEELGESNASKVRKKRIRDYTTVILQHMQEEQYIRSFSFTKKGKIIDGIKVTFPRESKSGKSASPGQSTTEIPKENEKENPNQSKQPV